MCDHIKTRAAAEIPDYSRRMVSLFYLNSGEGRQSPKFVPAWGRFPYWTFSYCLSGRGRLDFKDGKASFFSRPGHVSIGPADREYRGTVVSAVPGRYRWLHARFEVLGFWDPLASLDMPDVLPKDLSQEILAIGEAIARIKSAGDISAPTIAIELSYQGLRLLKALTDHFRWTRSPEASPEALNALRPALERLKSRSEKRVDIAELARAASMSLSTFHRHFKRTFGVTPYVYAEKERMREAAAALCRENVSIDELAKRSGYRDRFQFSKVFKRVYGQGPARYRGNYRALFS